MTILQDSKKNSELRPLREKKLFECTYCHRQFTIERRFLAHTCEAKRRDEIINTMIGQSAAAYYKHWLMNYKNAMVSDSTFIKSKYFNAFVEFANHSKAIKLYEPKRFIIWAISKNYDPKMWTMAEVWGEYSSYIESTLTPMRQVTMTINHLIDIADEHDVDISDVFTSMTQSEFVHLLVSRKLSPWLLLNSRKFLEFYSSLAGENRVKTDFFIDLSTWHNTFIKKDKDRKKIRAYLQKIGL